jgi:hypothetical protein
LINEAAKMSESIRITFSATDQTGQAVVNNAQALYQTLDRLQFTTNNLFNTGLQGGFLDELDARCRAIYNQLHFICDETNETGSDLLTVAEWFRQLDAECAAMFSTFSGISGIFPGVLVPLTDQSGSLADRFLVWAGQAYYSRVQGEATDVQKFYDRYGNYNDIIAGLVWLTQNRNIDKFALKDVDELSDWLFNKGAGQLASMTTTDAGFQQVLQLVRSPHFAVTKKFTSGALTGVLDYAFGGEYTTTEFATQTISGGLQGLMDLTPVGRGIKFVDAVAQFGGGILSEQIENNASWFAMGDAAQTAEIKQTADRFQDALEGASLDNRMDGIVRSAITGISEGRLDKALIGVRDELVTGLIGVGGVIVEGTGLAGHVVEGVGSQIAANTQIDETLNAVAQGAGESVNDVLDFFGI